MIMTFLVQFCLRLFFLMFLDWLVGKIIPWCPGWMDGCTLLDALDLFPLDD
jgi:hypothetical protein